VSAASAATAALATPNTAANSACGVRPYSYAGIAGWRTANGVAATLEIQAQPDVEHGHVAAWVGVGGVGLGPGGTNEWLQAGFAADGSSSGLYYEVAKPHAAPRYHGLSVVAGPGEAHRVAVIEMHARPDWWRIWVDGSAVSAPIFLPGSHDRWPPIVTSESWNGGVPSCNAFAYRFSAIRVRHASWTSLADAYPIQTPGYAVVWHPGTLVALGGAAREPLVVSP
jgi:hypothetical protein